MSVITRRQIAKLLQDIASNHYQIHTFGWGDVPELLGRQGTIYPFMMVTPENPVMGEGEVTHRFRISIADRLQKGIENIEDVDSDMYQVLRDIITQIDNVAYQDMRVDLPVTIEPFRAEDAQDVYGFSGVIDIIVDEDYDQCAIPSDDVPFDPVPPPSCLPATYRVEYASGTLIEEGTIDSGDSKTIIVPDCEDANWTLVDANGIVIDTGSIAAGGSATITAPNGAVTIQDSNGSTLYVVDVASNGSETQAVGDSTATVRNSNGVVVDSASILAEGSADLDAPDASVTVNGVAFKDVASGESGNIPVKKSSGSDLIGSKDGQFWRVGDSAITVRNSNNDVVDSGDVRATEAGNFVAPDGTVNVNKSDGSPIDSVDVASNDTDGYNVADSTVTNDATSPTYTANVKATEPLVLPRTPIEVNGVNEGDVKSVDTVEIEIVDDNDDPVTPTSVDVTGQVVKVEVPSGGAAPIFQAYGLRKIVTEYTGNAAVVRRDSDDATTDIGFDGNDFNLSAYNSFVGSGNGFCRNLYNQAETEAEEAFGSEVLANQPEIELKSGKASLKSRGALGANIGLTHGGGIYPYYYGFYKTGFCISYVYENTSNNLSNSLISSASPNFSWVRFNSIDTIRFQTVDELTDTNVGSPSDLRHILVNVQTNGNWILYVNGVSVNSGNINFPYFAASRCIFSGGGFFSEWITYLRPLDNSELNNLFAEITTYYGL